MPGSTDSSTTDSPDGELFSDRPWDLDDADTITIRCCECGENVETPDHPDDVPIALCRLCAIEKLVALGVA